MVRDQNIEKIYQRRGKRNLNCNKGTVEFSI